MTDIAIIGAGISGLTLALTLQQREVDCTVYTDRTSDEIRGGRLPNTVVRYGATLPRERALGVNHWEGVEQGPQRISLSVTGTPISFSGPLPEGGSAVDFRLYLPQLLDDFQHRGGRIGSAPSTFPGLRPLAERHALVVLAAGPGRLAAGLPRDPERSVHRTRQRLLCAGLWRGVDEAEPPGITYALAPGVGEIFEFPMFSRHGHVSAVLIEAVPDGPLSSLVDRRRPADAAFEQLVLDLLREHAPSIAERVTERTFHLTSSRDLFQGAVTPTVRRTWREVAPGRFLVALGDGWVVNDPITGQGANLASSCAAALADLIIEHAAYDERFCRQVDRRLWALAEPVCRFTTAMLEPPGHTSWTSSPPPPNTNPSPTPSPPTSAIHRRCGRRWPANPGRRRSSSAC